MFLSIVIPMHNEVGNVQLLLDEIEQVGDLLPSHEVICVDDGSTDGTGELLAAAAASRASHATQLVVVRHARSVGQSGALRSGIRAARGEWIATLDGDGQNDPADLPRLLETLGSAPVLPRLVAGERVRRNDPWVRRVSSSIANRVRSTVLRDQVRDTGCGIKLFPRAAFLDLPFFDHLHRFLPALFRAEGLAVVVVPVNHRSRHAGTSKYGIGNRLWVGLVDMLGVLWLQGRRVHPELTISPPAVETSKRTEPHSTPTRDSP